MEHEANNIRVTLKIKVFIYVPFFFMGKICQQQRSLIPNLKLPLITQNKRYKLSKEKIIKERKATSWPLKNIYILAKNGTPGLPFFL